MKSLANSWMCAGIFAICVGLFSSATPSYAEDPAAAKEEFTTRLFVAEADASNMKPVADLPDYQAQGSPSWSLDGKLIAFDAWMPQKGEDVPDSKVIVVNADGTNPRYFADALMPSFSPSGRRMVVSRPKAGGIWVIDLDRAEPDNYIQVDQQGWGADWSPDGKIVYAARDSGGANLKVVDSASGSGFVFNELGTPYQRIFWNMGWSRDDKYIAYKATNREGKIEMGIANTQDTAIPPLKLETGSNLLASFAWHPNGTVLFVKYCDERQHFQIYSVSPEPKSEPKLLAGCDPERSYADIAYSPDGNRILISCWKRTPTAKAEKSK